jgi:UDPglucose 6-dehydrogenase
VGAGVTALNVCVAGLWHLGSVTAACLASVGHKVVAYDSNRTTIENLSQGRPPISEPELPELVSRGMRNGHLRFTSDRSDALREADVLWIAYDTPVDEDDNADVDLVIREVEALIPLTREGSLILISSQIPVGTTRLLEHKGVPRRITFAYSPENLRLGKAIDLFMRPDRIVVGTRQESDRAKISELLKPVTTRIEWMSVESAEMTKHALNAFLATSVTFINEIATICERVGADAKEVERGLKSEKRIGPSAYLSPGAAFAGGTLARDVVFLSALGDEHHVATTLISSLKASNDVHRTWANRRLTELLGHVHGKRIAIWGLTYKPGTDTLRRSAAIELCRWLINEGAIVSAYDPAVKSLPGDLADQMQLAPTALDSAKAADALVVMTEWPEYREIDADSVAAALKGRLVLDANRFLAKQFENSVRLVYASVGKPVQ